MKSPVEKLIQCCVAGFAAAATLSLAGCAVQTATPNTSAVSLASISGNVHGGQQPVNGAKVYLFAVSATGYGQNANSILLNPGYVTTNSGGGFSITGDYTCPSNSQVYLAAVGGNPGLAAGTSNGQLTLLAGLGSCSSLTSATTVTINEVSTAAMVYAMSPFMSNYVQVATSSTNVSGMARAMANIPNLINVSSGTVLSTTPAGNGTVPAAEINTLADVIAPCVNSNGNDGTCTTLFSATTVSGSTAPNDTVTALLSIAKNPANNVAQIFALSSANAPFQPTLASAPNDWSLAVNYTGTSMTDSYGLAIDFNGNILVSSPSANSVTQFSFLGAPLATYTGNGLSSPRGLASDTLGNVYVANYLSNTVSRISNAGIVSTYTGGGLSSPTDVAVDGSNVVYVANYQGSTISEFSANGTAVSSTAGFAGGGVNAPTSIGVNGDGSVWTSNSGNNTVSRFSPTTGAYTSLASGFSGGGLNSPVGVAFDSSSNVFVSDVVSTVSKFSTAGVAATGSPYSGGGTGQQGGIAVDGDGNVFVALSGSNAIKELVSAGTAKSGSTGFASSGLNYPAKVAVDGSGNLWVTNNRINAASITEFIGIGAPTTAPLATAVNNGTVGKRP